MCNVVFVSGVPQSDTVIYIVFFIFFSIMAYCKILNIVPSAIQQVLVVYFIYSICYVYRNLSKLLIYPSLSPSPLW